MFVIKLWMKVPKLSLFTTLAWCLLPILVKKSFKTEFIATNNVSYQVILGVSNRNLIFTLKLNLITTWKLIEKRLNLKMMYVMKMRQTFQNFITTERDVICNHFFDRSLRSEIWLPIKSDVCYQVVKFDYHTNVIFSINISL